MNCKLCGAEMSYRYTLYKEGYRIAVYMCPECNEPDTEKEER